MQFPKQVSDINFFFSQIPAKFINLNTQQKKELPKVFQLLDAVHFQTS